MRTFSFRAFVCIVLLVSSSCTGTKGLFPAHPLANGWEARWMDFADLESFDPAKEAKGSYSSYSIPSFQLEEPDTGVLVLRLKLPSLETWNSPTLLIRGNAQLMASFIGGVKRDELVKISKLESGDFSYHYKGDFQPLIDLPLSAQNTEIYLLFHKKDNHPVGFSEIPLLTHRKTALQIFSNRVQTFSSLGFFLLALSIFSIYLWWHRKKRAILGFIFYSSIAGIHFLSQSGFFGLITYESYDLAFNLYTISLLLVPPAGLYFLDKLFGMGRWNIIRMLWQFHLFFDALFLFLNYTGHLSFSLTFIMFSYLLLPTLLLQVLVVWGEIISKKKSSWILGVGSTLLVLGYGHDLIADVHWIDSLDLYSPWGLFSFMFSLSVYGEQMNRDSEIKHSSLQKEIVTAAKIQNAILPPNPPHWDGFEIGVYYKPSYDVGGDFYDFQALGEDRYCLLIADVVGHGLGASIIASLSKFAFFQHYNLWQNPSFLLSAMNSYLVKRSEGRFTTAAYIFLDKKKNKYIHSSAGHPPFLHYKKSSGAVSEVKPKGKPLGILLNSDYFEEEGSFSPGDRFLFFTDGLVEETDGRGQEFGTERLVEAFRKSSGLTVENSISGILGEMQNFTGLGHNPIDDITLIILEIKEFSKSPSFH